MMGENGSRLNNFETDLDAYTSVGGIGTYVPSAFVEIHGTKAYHCSIMPLQTQQRS